MFSIQQIKMAHAQVKSGADFPKYVQDLIALGVTHYDCYVSDGHTDYYGSDGFTISSEAKYAVLDVAGTGDTARFIDYLKLHQQGGSAYPEFCEHAALTGVEKWTVDMDAMTCSYYDKDGNTMLVEQVPVVK